MLTWLLSPFHLVFPLGWSPTPEKPRSLLCRSWVKLHVSFAAAAGLRHAELFPPWVTYLLNISHSSLFCRMINAAVATLFFFSCLNIEKVDLLLFSH